MNTTDLGNDVIDNDVINENEVVLGIDFGTTNSCMSVYRDGKSHVLPNMEGNYTTPTCIFFDMETSDILFGEPAYQLLMSKNNSLFLSNIVHNIKRLVGISFDEYKNNAALSKFFAEKGTVVQSSDNGPFCSIQVNFNGKSLKMNVSEVVKLFIKHLTQSASQQSGYKIEKIVITVPAYFTDKQRQLMKSSCESIGLIVLRVINEPTAAALAYAKENLDADTKLKPENVLVIDCGGGTTDVSLLHMDYQEHIFEVKNVMGNNFLGGEDLTNGLVDYVCKKLKLENPTTKQLNKIKAQCELCKKQLSFCDTATIYLEVFQDDKDCVINISKQQFLECNKAFFESVRNLVKDVAFGCAVKKVILVGGTTRIPVFVDICKETLHQNVTVCNDFDPDHTISIGASIQGALLSKVSNATLDNLLLLDVVPMSLGVDTIGGIMSVLVSKNTHVPVSRSQVFTNSENYIEELQIEIYQGERKFAKDNQLLASFTLSELDNTLKKGEMHIRVTFSIDTDCIISVVAEESSTQASSTIQVSKHASVEYCDASDDTFDDYMILDSYRSHQILAKLDLYDTFKNRLSIFHEKRLQFGFNDENSKFSFRDYKLNELFNETFCVIADYVKHSPTYIEEYKKNFENNWHLLMIDFDTSNLNNIPEEIGSTQLIDELE
jgi:L1 cell adhesion molecule like protein